MKHVPKPSLPPDIQVGDPAGEVSSRAPIVGGPLPEPVWHIFVALPQREARLRDWLIEEGVDAWFPEVERVRRIHTKPDASVTVIRPAVSGYVLARFEAAPVWSAVLACRHMARAVCRDGIPIRVPEWQVMQMDEVPQVLAEIKAAEEARRAEERSASMPVAGEPARIETGVFMGHEGTPIRVNGDYARFEIGTMQVDVHVSAVRRIGGAP